MIQFKRMKTSICLILLSCFLLAACNTVQKSPEKEKPAAETMANGPVPSAPEPEVENVDFVALQRFLGLERASQRLGYAEKSFNTCDVGYGFSKSHNCRQRYFVVVHFQMMCRDSEGTVSQIVRPSDLQANSNRSVRWNLKDYNGIATTDGDGYGQIRVVSGQSQKQQRLKLAIASDFLYLRAGEIQKVVTPRNWCQQ